MPKLIVLDRDGVINQDSEAFIKSPAEWQEIPGSLAAIAVLNAAGYAVVVATNQSGIARGYFTPQDLAAIHHKMEMLLAEHGGKLAGIFICPHGPNDNCECRKPKPGLLLEIAQKFNLRPQDMLVVGDSLRDILSAQACGAEAVLVRTGKGMKTTDTAQIDVPIYDDLASFVQQFLER
jgi:D-glycero-D-manno-heptose 1,7-bisphosphate phosphatase